MPAIVLLAPIYCSFEDIVCPGAIKIAFFPALAFYIFCFLKCSSGQKQRTANDLGLFAICSVVAIPYIPLVLIALPYVIYKRFVKDNSDYDI